MNKNLKYVIAGGLICGLSSALWCRIGISLGIRLLANEIEKQLPEAVDAWVKEYRDRKRYDVKM